MKRQDSKFNHISSASKQIRGKPRNIINFVGKVANDSSAVSTLSRTNPPTSYHCDVSPHKSKWMSVRCHFSSSQAFLSIKPRTGSGEIFKFAHNRDHLLSQAIIINHNSVSWMFSLTTSINISPFSRSLSAAFSDSFTEAAPHGRRRAYEVDFLLLSRIYFAFFVMFEYKLWAFLKWDVSVLTNNDDAGIKRLDCVSKAIKTCQK